MWRDDESEREQQSAVNVFFHHPVQPLEGQSLPEEVYQASDVSLRIEEQPVGNNPLSHRKKGADKHASHTVEHPAESRRPVIQREQAVKQIELFGAHPGADEPLTNEERSWKGILSPKAAERAEKRLTSTGTQPWGKGLSFNEVQHAENQLSANEDRAAKDDVSPCTKQSDENRPLDGGDQSDEFRVPASPCAQQAAEPESSPLSSDPLVRLIIIQL